MLGFCLSLAAAVCLWVQLQGRWSALLWANTLIFGALGVTYSTFALRYAEAFDRTPREY